MDKPTVPDVVPLFAAFYQMFPTWGVLHIVLDDGNVENHFIESCIAQAEETGDEVGALLGRTLLKMSKTQRLKLPFAVYKFVNPTLN